jgi:hypothetical protein
MESIPVTSSKRNTRRRREKKKKELASVAFSRRNTIHVTMLEGALIIRHDERYSLLRSGLDVAFEGTRAAGEW